MDISDFDVILGMDWLTAHQVVIDCNSRRITAYILAVAPYSEMKMYFVESHFFIFLTKNYAPTTFKQIIINCRFVFVLVG